MRQHKYCFSYVKDLETESIIYNKNNYKWWIYCNKRNGAWVFHWKYDHKEWKYKQGKKSYIWLVDSVTNEVIYCSYPVLNIEEYMK